MTACPDLVTFLGAESLFGDAIEVNGENVVPGLEGFLAGTTFLTAEGQSNDTVLRASFTANPISAAPVSLPAAAWLLIAAMRGLAAQKPRKKAARQKARDAFKGRRSDAALFVNKGASEMRTKTRTRGE